MSVSKFNNEGYYDPVVYEALTKVEAEERAARAAAAYRPLVYICSPYAGDTQKNTYRARAFSRFAVEENCIPMTPHLLFPQFMDEATERWLGLKMGIVLLSKCEQVWVFGDVISEGMAAEIEKAKKQHKRIRYFTEDLKEVGQLIRQTRGSVKEKNLIDKYVGQINYLSQELKKINSKRESLFENFAEGILDETEYQFAKKKYDDEAAEIEKKLTVEKANKVQLDDILSLSNEWLVSIHKAENITEIDAGLVKHLVGSVKIFEDNRVEVELNFGDQRNIFNSIMLRPTESPIVFIQ